MIYIIFGASGTGKTTLMNSVYSECGEKAIHKKGTTRKKRKYDDIEIESYPDGLPEEKFGPGKGYIYSTYGYQYGIEKKQIEDAISGKYPHFVICNDVETIKKLRKDFSTNIVVIYLSFDAARETILQIQKTRDITDDEIETRMDKIEYLNKEFIDNSSLFDQVIINRYGDNPEIMLWSQMARIMAVYEKGVWRSIPAKEVLFEMIDYLKETIDDVNKNKIFINDNVEKGFIFVIMPMMNESDEMQIKIHNVYATIKAVAADIKYRAQRVDEISGSKSIDNKIFEHIKKAELIIADLSYERPNCYFELGYALALGKEIIIISENGSKIHFDVDHYDNFSYKNPVELSGALKSKLQEFRMKHPLSEN